MVFFIIFFGFFGILIGANIYIPSRFAWYFDINSPGIIYFISVAITVFSIGGLIPLSNSLSKLGRITYRVAAVTLGLMLYLLLSVVMTDILRIFTSFQPWIYGSIAISSTLVISLYGILNSNNLRISKIEIPIPGLTKEIKALHLSDIHIGHFRGKPFLQKIVDQANKLHPDVVFLTGDLFDGKINLKEETIQPLKQIKVPVFFVEGNHDIYTDVKTIKALLRKNGIHVLENEIIQWDGIQIIGLNHMLADRGATHAHASSKSITIRKVLDNLSIDKHRPSILLHHSPDGIEFASDAGIDLYLSGHTHAGQLFPINYISKWLFTFNRGLHHYNGTRIYVSEGVGTFGPPMRVATRSEMTLITVIPDGKGFITDIIK
jgi:predicted MPP superfamily phosphohydrolase